MSGAANRRRGADAERAVVAWLRDHGYPDARRYLAGDGRQPGDIDFHPLICLEVKDRAESSWPTWCRQAAAEARAGMVPVVVRRTRGVTDVGAWEARYLLVSWPDEILLPIGHSGTNAAFQVDGRVWCSVPFSTLVSALWAHDHPEEAA